ncbi:alpha/beta hydrolase [Flavobacterium sp. AC]|uniref:Alpha/beta hydrolase n=1 Tax=Flavobacterium azizsancarii TaxID=2961580 RepID=A0ABT4WC41_9FLAO|nr:alpha/beta hydrolase [Flavobacterium azizsancarii]MDA6070096.1 alpha/beta hydrolase [Flavobacterium azizsancarii]
MKNTNLKNIDSNLWQAIIKSEYMQIDYESLLENDPAQIRAKELTLSLKEESAEIPDELHLENIQIPSSKNKRTISLRTYKPAKKGTLPVLLYFHGGAFIYGTPEQYDFLFFRLAIDINAVIVSLDYRLAPEDPFPAALEDGYDALLWLSEYAGDIQGDKNNIIIGGSSAGATIAASLAHLARDKKQVEIQHQYLLYPAMDHRLKTQSMQDLANAPMQSKKAAQWMWKHYLPHLIDKPPRYAVPLLEDNFKDLPTATIIVCELDPLRDEGKKYAAKLQQAGIAVNLLEIQGAVHAFDFFPCQLSDAFYTQQVQLYNEILNPEK